MTVAVFRGAFRVQTPRNECVPVIKALKALKYTQNQLKPNKSNPRDFFWLRPLT